MQPLLKRLFFISLLIICSFSILKAEDKSDIVIENAEMRLIIGSNGKAKSLVHKSTGQECLQVGVDAPVFSITQFRPYENELQLKYPANPRAFAAESVTREGDHLMISFELINIVAIVKVKTTDSYIGFMLEKFDFRLPVFGDKLKTDVDEFVLLQLPVKDRTNFGELLNVSWDNQVAVNLLGTDPCARIDAVKNKGYHLMRAQAVPEVKGIGVGAALITTTKDNLLNCVDRVEQDFHLPRGVESRRKKEYAYSYYETWDATPKNIDQHIAYAKKGGFRAIQIVWTAFASTIGNFPWQPTYPNGMEDLKLVVRKIKDAGMIAGAHFWYNKAMKKDSYVTPVPDFRLNLSRTFTLASPLDEKSTNVIVEENPMGCTLDNERRILKIGNELIQYEGYSNERPYTFTSCKRGILDTKFSGYNAGYKFGLLDVDTWPIWVRFDQRTSIQQEVADKIGKIYNDAGFQFVYFDGAEDIPQPYWYNTSMAQLKVYNSIKQMSMFSEGALRSHFSWHILTRGNAFDVFKPEIVKEATIRHPLDEIKFVSQDFTSINFGWVNYLAPSEKTIGMQPDMYEFVCSKAASYNCPISLIGKVENFESHPRTADNLDVMKRWEDARLNGFFSEEQKKAMRDPKQEHILLIDEKGKFELQPYEQISDAAKSNPAVRAFVFARSGKTCVVYWHAKGEGKLMLNLKPENLHLFKQLGKELKIEKKNGGVILPLSDRHILEIDLNREEVVKALRNAQVI